MNGLLPHRTLSMCSSSYNRYYSFLRIRRIAPLPPPPITLAPLVSARFHIQSSTHVYIHFFWLASFDSRFCFTVSSHFYLFHSLSRSIIITFSSPSQQQWQWHTLPLRVASSVDRRGCCRRVLCFLLCHPTNNHHPLDDLHRAEWWCLLAACSSGYCCMLGNMSQNALIANEAMEDRHKPLIKTTFPRLHEI